jgi:ribosomal protein S18 acetylase RimI-like enzyme
MLGQRLRSYRKEWRGLNSNEKMYLSFRCELDEICAPEILKVFEVKKIFFKGQKVGIMVYAPDYIDCIYIEPQYRRKGLARKAALEFWEENRRYNDIRLHIINKNKVAKKFWHSVFNLELILRDEIDGLYRIRGLK